MLTVIDTSDDAVIYPVHILEIRDLTTVQNHGDVKTRPIAGPETPFVWGDNGNALLDIRFPTRAGEL